MNKSVSHIAFAAALLLTLAFASIARASMTPPERESLLVYSQLKTFGQFTDALVRAQLATLEEKASIESTLTQNGLSRQTELAPGIFTDTRLTWGDVRLTRLTNGDWKTQTGRILSAKPGTKIDQIFLHAMSALNPRNAQRTPLDLLIDSAEAQPTAQERASAAGGWSLTEFLRRSSSTLRAGWNNYSRDTVACTPAGGYVINNGYKMSGTDWSSEKAPDSPVGHAILKAICPRVDVPKCSDNQARAVEAVLRQVCGFSPLKPTLGQCAELKDENLTAAIKTKPTLIKEAKHRASEDVFCTPSLTDLGDDTYGKELERTGRVQSRAAGGAKSRSQK